MPALYLGIDLGTSNSTAAVFDGHAVAMVRNGQGSFLTPSVVRLDGRGGVTVGARARRFLETHPDDVAAEFKRLMGTASRIAFAAAAVERTPLELSAEILKALRADVSDQTGCAPTAAVVSVPALFELPQCEATAEAARMAGFERCELIQEPIASALASGWTAAAEGSWLVYDLGGGTFDVSLLEEQEGFLHVVGHDGDNFLGGRDFDWAVVDWALAETGGRLRRDDPAQKALVRQIKLAAEEARIELTRAASTVLSVPDLDLDLPLDREQLEQLCTPLVARSIEVCRRLLAEHARDGRRLARVVLVGGPTVMPFLRRQVADALGVPFGDNLDPMALVAQGAALHAAAMGLDGAGAPPPEERGHRFTLNYPPMTGDPTPTVVGRRIAREEAGAPTGVRLVRADGWKSADCPLNEEGAFIATVELRPHQANDFRLEGTRGEAVRPGRIQIVHGVTVGAPPLSRTVGVATADDHVRVFFSRGTALPTRRTWTFKTVETVARGSAQTVLQVPIVQGESDLAHLCRVIGSVEIRGADLPASLPVHSPVEVTLELDRSGRLTARAHVPSLGAVFEQVARLLLPEASVDALRETLQSHRARLHEMLREPPAEHFEALLKAQFLCAQAEADVGAAAGGDADAAQKARRTLLEVDEILERAHGAGRWSELDQEALDWSAAASYNVAEWGTPVERGALESALRNLEMARAGRRYDEFGTCLGVVRKLALAARRRCPDFWSLELDYYVGHLDDANDLGRASALVAEGCKARERGDENRLRAICRQLYDLYPPDAEGRRMGHGSGVR